MSSEFIGVIRDAETKDILAVINPDNDVELDNPRWLLIRIATAAIELIKIPRNEYMGALTMEQLSKLVDEACRR